MISLTKLLSLALSVIILSLLINISALALFNPYTYLNYLQDLETAANSARPITNEVRQINNQLQSIEYQAKNSDHISIYQWQNITQLIQQLDQATQQGQALSYSAANVDSNFRKMYPNYSVHPVGKKDYTQTYQQWNATTLDTLRSTLDAAGMSAGNFQNEEQLLQQLKNQGQTAQGRMQVLQVSTEISADDVNQLEELKRIMLQQTNSQNAYMAYQVSKDSYDEQSLQEIDSNMPTAFPKYHDNPDFGEIK
jgi:type IV secretion system protein TrbJ